jgi:hypothetical protein
MMANHLENGARRDWRTLVPESGSENDLSALATQFSAIRDRQNRVEALGHAIVDYALTEAPRRGRRNGDKIELQMDVTVTIEPGVKGPMDTDCVHMCMKAGSSRETCTLVCMGFP